MANATGSTSQTSIGLAIQETYEDDIDSEEEDEEEEDETASTSGNGKLNGTVSSLETDRFGFIGGDQYTDPDRYREERIPVGVLRKRELKWLDMLENWEKWMSKRFKKVKDRCRKGIPPSLRARAWQYLCGSKFLMEHNRGRFEELLKQDGDPRWVDDITKDLHRQFPFHEMFLARGGQGQEDLFRVLKAYAVHNPKDGYCQAQAPIAAVLLMHMPAEQAFWCLVSICDKYLPGYYSPGLEAVQTDGDVLFGLLKKATPSVYKHMKKQRIDPILYMTEWFMCVYSRTLPWSTVLRCWDMFFCEGVKVMFRIAIVLFKFTLGRPDVLPECQGLYETMEKLKNLPPEILKEDFLCREVNRISISERDMEKEHQYQIAKRRASKEKSKNPGHENGKSKKRFRSKKSPGEES